MKKENEIQISIVPDKKSYRRYTVYRITTIGNFESVGAVMKEFDEKSETYISLDTNGEEMFPATNNFSEVEKNYANHISFLEAQEKNKRLLLTNNKNQQTMTTQNNKPKKENQFVFVEYENPNDQGHFITVMDLYRNVIGRIHRKFNEQTKKYEFTAYDHKGDVMFVGDQAWKLKKEFTNDREKLLEDAHQRRIESKKAKSVEQEVKSEKPKEKPIEKQQPTKEEERKKEMEDLRNSKEENKERGINR